MLAGCDGDGGQVAVGDACLLARIVQLDAVSAVRGSTGPHHRGVDQRIQRRPNLQGDVDADPIRVVRTDQLPLRVARRCRWEVVSDPTRYAELSPENVGADTADGITLGVTFTGHNRRDGNEWSVPCVVTTLDEPTAFAFHAGDDETGTTWRFDLRDLGDDRTQIVQSFDSLRLRHPEWIDALPARHAQLVGDMQTTLAAVQSLLGKDAR